MRVHGCAAVGCRVCLFLEEHSQLTTGPVWFSPTRARLGQPVTLEQYAQQERKEGGNITGLTRIHKPSTKKSSVNLRAPSRRLSRARKNNTLILLLENKVMKYLLYPSQVTLTFSFLIPSYWLPVLPTAWYDAAHLHLSLVFKVDGSTIKGLQLYRDYSFRVQNNIFSICHQTSDTFSPHRLIEFHEIWSLQNCWSQMGDYNLSVTLSLKCDAIDQIGGQGSNQLANRNIKHLTRVSGCQWGLPSLLMWKVFCPFPISMVPCDSNNAQ